MLPPGSPDTITVEIDVYTDAGPPLARKRLAQRRADRVKLLLVGKGVRPDRIVAAGKGAVDFIAGNDAPEERAQNDRVMIRRLSGCLDVHPASGGGPPQKPEAPGGGR